MYYHSNIRERGLGYLPMSPKDPGDIPSTLPQKDTSHPVGRPSSEKGEGDVSCVISGPTANPWQTSSSFRGTADDDDLDTIEPNLRQTRSVEEAVLRRKLF